MNTSKKVKTLVLLSITLATPESYNQVFATVEPLVKGQIIAVFGSPGEEMTLKGPFKVKLPVSMQILLS